MTRSMSDTPAESDEPDDNGQPLYCTQCGNTTMSPEPPAVQSDDRSQLIDALQAVAHPDQVDHTPVMLWGRLADYIQANYIPKAEAVQGDELDALFKKHAKWNYSNGAQGTPEEMHFYTLKDLEDLKTAIQAQVDEAVREAENRARHVLHCILSDDVDSELDHSDIEARFVAALTTQPKPNKEA